MYICDGPWCCKPGTRRAANPQESLASLDGKQSIIGLLFGGLHLSQQPGPDSPLSPPDEEGPEGLTQFLMMEVKKVRAQRKEHLLKEHQLQVKNQALEQEQARLKQQLQELLKVQERCQRLREEWDTNSMELLRLKDENYMMAMRYAQLCEEKNMAVLRSRDLQLVVRPWGVQGLVVGGGGGLTAQGDACRCPCVVAREREGADGRQDGCRGVCPLSRAEHPSHGHGMGDLLLPWGSWRYIT